MKANEGQKVQFHTFLNLIGPTSSYLQQCTLLYQVQCQAQLNSLFYKCLMLFSLSSYHVVATLLTLIG
jgi:hypothetical protein